MTPEDRKNMLEAIESDLNILRLKQEIPRKRRKIIKQTAIKLFDALKAADNAEDQTAIIDLLHKVAAIPF